MTLRQHAPRHDQIGPIKMSISQLFGIAGYEPAFPRIGQQRRDGDQAEWGGGESGAIKLAGSSKIPERLPVEARCHQENFAMLRQSMSPRSDNPTEVTRKSHQGSAPSRRNCVLQACCTICSTTYPRGPRG